MNYLFILLGFVFMGLGCLGIILPILPTVPFLLVSSFCFAKGSKKFHDWFKSTKIYINHLESFEKNRSMTLKTKLYILIPVAILLIIAFLMMNNIYGRITVILVLFVKSLYFMFGIKTIPNKKL